jgi:dTMP kinase
MNSDIRQIADRLRGRFVVLDGPDGAGKSSQHKRIEAALRGAGLDVVSCRDPGGTVIGDRIRSILLNYDLTVMDVNCETMLFMASRAQLVAEVVRPALSAGKTVLCDRFVTSTCAYQGAAGYDPRRVIELARFALNDFWPDVTIVLDIDPEIGFARIGRTPRHAGKNRTTRDSATLFPGAEPADAMEARSLDFHRRVRAIFQEVAAYYPTAVVMVNAADDEEQVYARIVSELIRALT